MTNAVKIIGVVLFLVIAGGCEIDKCFKKTGSQTSNTAFFDSIGAIHVNGMFNVELVQDTSYFIEAIGYEQAIKGIEIVENNDSVTIYYYNNCFWRRDFDRPLIRIHFSDIHALNIFEASYIFSTDSITDSFKFTVRSSIAEADLIFNNRKVYFYINKSCGGKFVFRGKTDYAYLMNFNTGLFEMDELECKRASVKNYSSIDVKVNVVEELKVEIYNTGNILYRGNPVIVVDTLASSGRVLPLN